MLVLPALVALPAVRVKFTALAERLTVNDSPSVAFNAIGCAPEFSACADAREAGIATSIASSAIRIKLCLADFMSLLVLNSPWVVTASVRPSRPRGIGRYRWDYCRGGCVGKQYLSNSNFRFRTKFRYGINLAICLPGTPSSLSDLVC